MLLLLFVAPATAAMSKPIDESILYVETSKGRVEFNVETATTDAERERGLMYRREMPANHGMIFIFVPDRSVTFTMRNTYMPLDMIFIKPDGTIESILENTEPLTKGPYPSKGDIGAVLEINGGKARELGIKPGDKVQHILLGNLGN